MKTARNLFQIYLLGAMLLPVVMQAQLTWGVVNGTASITGYTGNPTALNIPSATNGYPVTTISGTAFQNKSTLTSVIIPNSVTNIGGGAFQFCSSLTSVTMGSGVIAIGSSAFNGCTKLPGVTLPNSIVTLGGNAFQKCTNLAAITLGNSLVQIGANAFAYCYSLTNIMIPSTTTNIQTQPFYYCTSLTAITVDAQNPAYSSVSGVWFDKSQKTLLQFPDGRGGSYAIPTNVTTIGSGALWNCVNLTNITIPASVTNLPQGPLTGCASLQTIVVDAQNPFYSSLAGVLFDKTQMTLLQFPGGRAGSYTIPNGVTIISGLSFAFCNNLTNVIFPGSVNSLGSYAFEDCFSLTSVFFEGNAPPQLGTYVFFYDTNATAYYLPGTTGWGEFSGPPIAQWFLPNPVALNGGSGFGLQTNGFSFTISWATNISVVVEACTNLFNPAWQPAQTNALTNGTCYFSDPQWTNYSDRFYRIRSQ